MNIRQYDYRMIIDEIMNKLHQSTHQSGVEISRDTLIQLEEIRRIASLSYNDNINFNDAALNREILLNKEITALLTPELLKAIFTISMSNDKSHITLTRLNTHGYHPTILAVIYDALKDGVDALELLSNHNGLELHWQVEKFQANTTQLLTNILSLATELGVDLNDFVYLSKKEKDQNLKLSERLEVIGKSMDSIMAREKTNRFLYTSNDMKTDLAAECLNGFNHICGLLSCYIYNQPLDTYSYYDIKGCISLDHFVENFLNNENASNFFLDKFPLQAGISLNVEADYKLGNRMYSMRKILKAILIAAEKDKFSEFYLQLKLRIQLIEQHLHDITPRNYLPDNALRMIQLLEKYSVDASAADKAYYAPLIKRLMRAQEEEHALQVFKDMSVESLSSAQFEELQLASFTNEELLENANDSQLKPEYNKTCFREIEGRLLRSEKIPGVELDIEKKLKEKKYLTVQNSITNDFAEQANILLGYFSSRKDELKNHPKGSALNNIFSHWVEVSNNHYKASEYLLIMRNQFLALQEKIPDLKQAMKSDRHPWLSHLHAAFVALGCIAIVGLPFTCYYMYRSWRDKGTVFFTHAPETMKISHEAEKSLMTLGQRITP